MERFRKLRASHGRDRPFQDGTAERGYFCTRKPSASAKRTDSNFDGSNLNEGNLFTVEFRSDSSQRAKTPIKTLIAEEMSRGAESRRRSPSVIARLMGLDTLPASNPAHRQKKLPETYSERAPVFRGSHVWTEEHSLQRNCDIKQSPEFKDIYEVFESTKANIQNNLGAQKASTGSRTKEEKTAFIRQKFMDVKHLSTDENLRHSKEFHDALDILHSNKDLFLKILEEPDSLFAKHLNNLQASSNSSHITVLKSSKPSKHENADKYFMLDRNIEGNVQNEKHVCSSHRLQKSQFEGKIEASLPTRIVVLKPNMGKAENLGKPGLLSDGVVDSHSLHKKHREARKSGSRDLFPELRSRSKLYNTSELVRQRPKGSREIAKEITQQMRESVSGQFSSNVPNPRMKGFAACESLYKVPSKDHSDNLEVVKSHSKHFYEWDSRCSPSSRSADSYVSREARKRLSDRWKMTTSFQDVEPVSRGMSTLGEMLALHDRESLAVPPDSAFGQAFSRDRLERGPTPLGISSRDGWKDGYPRCLPRSRSIPSSTLYGSPKMRSRHGVVSGDRHLLTKELSVADTETSLNKDFLKYDECSSRSTRFASGSSHSRASGGFVNESPDVLSNISGLGGDFEENILEPKSFIRNSCATSELPKQLDDSVCEAPNSPVKIKQEETLWPTSGSTSKTDLESSTCDDNKFAKEHSVDPQIEPCSNVSASESTQSSKEAEQPSPVSVLEPLEDESSSSECFERVTADLQGLRLQLQLLKLEAAEASTDGSDLNVSSDEDNGDVCARFQEDKRKFSGVLWDNDNWDFSYVADTLICSDLVATDQEMLFATCYSSESPVGPSVFEKLEKKYGEQPAWMKHERKLLFDRINCCLSEILSGFMDERPWLKTEGRRVQFGWSTEALTEEVWQMLDRQTRDRNHGPPEKALCRDGGWMELADDVDVIGREVESFLIGELVEEVITAFTHFDVDCIRVGN